MPVTIDASCSPDATATEAHKTTQATAFIGRWQGITASELSTAQSFVRELCELLSVPAPHPTDDQSYMFERPITFSHGDGTLPEQVRAVAQVLASANAAPSLSAIEACFKGKGPWKRGLPRILKTLEALGRARREGDGNDWRG